MCMNGHIGDTWFMFSFCFSARLLAFGCDAGRRPKSPPSAVTADAGFDVGEPDQRRISLRPRCWILFACQLQACERLPNGQVFPAAGLVRGQRRIHFGNQVPKPHQVPRRAGFRADAVRTPAVAVARLGDPGCRTYAASTAFQAAARGGRRCAGVVLSRHRKTKKRSRPMMAARWSCRYRLRRKRRPPWRWMIYAGSRMPSARSSRAAQKSLRLGRPASTGDRIGSLSGHSTARSGSFQITPERLEGSNSLDTSFR